MARRCPDHYWEPQQ